MKLTDEQLKKSKEWFDSKGINLTCPICSSHKLSPVPELTFQPIFHRGGVVIEEQSVPLIQVVCSDCAHVLNFSAMMILEKLD